MASIFRVLYSQRKIKWVVIVMFVSTTLFFSLTHPKLAHRELYSIVRPSYPGAYGDISADGNLLMDNLSMVVLGDETFSTRINSNDTDSRTFQLLYDQQVQHVIYDEQPFPYLTNESDLCLVRYPNVFVLIVIHTAPEHFKLRAVIRDTWANTGLYKDLHTVPIFLLGNPDNDVLKRAVAWESEIYRDIIQEDYIDSYRNLTYKAISGLRWVTRYCRNARFVLKVDDDVIVNTYRVVRYLRRVHRENSVNSWRSFYCLRWKSMDSNRNPKSKWFVTPAEFPGKKFPDYCSGSAFVIPVPLVPPLYNATFTTRFLWIDDVYLTGMLAGTTKAGHVNIPKWYVFEEKNFKKELLYGEAVFGHQVSLNYKQRYQYWDEIKLIES